MISISIDTSNEAFQNGNRNTELARILREASDQLSAGRFNLLDSNGNRVGQIADTELSVKDTLAQLTKFAGPKTFSVYFATDNDAFTYDKDAAIDEVMNDIASRVARGDDGFPILDDSGNSIGKAHTGPLNGVTAKPRTTMRG